MYLLDSNIIIFYLKKDTETVKMIDKLDVNFCTSVVCIGEVLEGLSSKKSPKKTKVFEQLIKNIKIIPIDLETTRVFAKTRKNLRKRGKLIGDMDTFIAATCISNKYTLITHNIKHFSRISELKIHKS